MEVNAKNPDLSSNVKKSSIEQQEKRLEKRRNALMVVASLIAAMAFQVGVNPPGGVWQETIKVDSKDTSVSAPSPYSQGPSVSAPSPYSKGIPLMAGESIYAHNHPARYGRFLIINTTGLIASLSIILLLVSGLPMGRIFVLILMVITWIAITAVAFSYLLSISALTPRDVHDEQSYVVAVNLTVFIWLGLMVLLLIGHMIRLIIKTIRKLMECLGLKEKTGNSGSTSHPTV